ncbi:MAG: 2-succinyl-5-enolpyruvyl-6-hydroxy-3-cyclohexene-1-carboxylic-acid synthase [Bacteroidota bacterium]
MKYSDIPSAQTVVLYLKAADIKHIVISPGSRNAPLILGFTKNDWFSCYSIVDERVAGFFALGMAKNLKQPVAVLCTSGSALLNYHPAISEAYYSEIPLVVISADRPSYKIDIGDGQTIRQENVFTKHIGYAANLKQDISHATKTVEDFGPNLLNDTQQQIQAHNQTELERALSSCHTEKLPIHINVPFEEPLYGTTHTPSIAIPDLNAFSENREASLTDYGSFAKQWQKSKRKMILVGVAQPHLLEPEIVKALGTDPSVLIFTETTSNLQHPNFFSSIDSIIAPIEKSEDAAEKFEKLQPEILITLGGLIVSKKVKAFLRKYKPLEHWHVSQGKAYDTFFCLKKHFKTNPNSFLKVLTDSSPTISNYTEPWLAVKTNYEKRLPQYLEKIPFSDFSAFALVQKTIPEKYQVHLANSSTVRYSQLFDMNPSLDVFCNRGTSGIDGSTSTAVGAAVHHPTPTVLITGDLSFFYDSNALWNTYTRSDFRIVVLNNEGGGIFRILPGKEETEDFKTYFETSHGLEASHLAQMFGFSYQKVGAKAELEHVLKTFYDRTDQPKILEIVTPRTLNNKILLDYFDFIS